MPNTTDKDKQNGRVAILGVFVADAAYRASRQPNMGETIPVSYTHLTLPTKA